MKTDRQTLATRLRRWIAHKNQLSKHSQHYKNAAVASDLSFVNSVFSRVSRNCWVYTDQQVAGLVIMCQNRLLAVLPNRNNPSFASSEQEIYEIIELSKNILRGKRAA